jgi:hypothetical protein
MAEAKGAVEAFEIEIKPARDAAEERRKTREKNASEKLEQWKKDLPSAVDKWVTESNPAASALQWTLITPSTASASSGGVYLAIEKDGTIAASGVQNRTDYNLVLNVPQEKITGLLIEVLPDAAAPGFGPGRNTDGNFIVSEISAKFVAGAKVPEKPVSFEKAWASFEQEKFPVMAAIDGKDSVADNGWAVGKGTGRRQIAAFQVKQPLIGSKDAVLTLRIGQKARDNFQIGRLRVYVTGAAEPLGEGVPAVVAEAAAAAPESRTDAQKETLQSYYRTSRAEYWAIEKELVEAKKPLPADPKLVELREKLAKASEPIRLDPDLVQLRIDAEASKKQIANKRLTAAQDLAWALINNPAFLFNR